MQPLDGSNVRQTCIDGIWEAHVLCDLLLPDSIIFTTKISKLAKNVRERNKMAYSACYQQ